MPNYISAIFLDFDNVFSSLFNESKEAAREFAKSPATWLNSFKGMKGTENEETNHNFVIRRCYMNPAGRISNSDYYSQFRQNFVRDGWEVIDTPPLTKQGKTSADTHIVMDVLDAVAQYPLVTEYLIMAADADYTPLVIRLRKHLKTTVIYAPKKLAVAYQASCDSVIEEAALIDLLSGEDEDEEERVIAPVIVDTKGHPDRIKEFIARYFAESEPGHKATVSTLGKMLVTQFPDISNGWGGYNSLSQLLKRLCGLSVEKVENRTVAWREEGI